MNYNIIGLQSKLDELTADQLDIVEDAFNSFVHSTSRKPGDDDKGSDVKEKKEDMSILFENIDGSTDTVNNNDPNGGGKGSIGIIGKGTVKEKGSPLQGTPPKKKSKQTVEELSPIVGGSNALSIVDLLRQATRRKNPMHFSIELVKRSGMYLCDVI